MTERIEERDPVEGAVAPGFEAVKQVFERETQTMAEKSAQLCVYYKGNRVVDLWRSAASDPEFSPDSLVNVFSSGKSLETIAVASLVGRGLLDYKDRIADFWPGFEVNGKGALTVADLMRHEGGMAAFDTPLDPDDLLRENIKTNKVGEVVERQHARFRDGEGNRREYHSITRGWIVNELFRRVDPSGRTVGEFLRDEISGPLEADALIGVEKHDLRRISKVVPLGVAYQLLQSLKPRALGRKIKLGFRRLVAMLLRIVWSLRNATVRDAPPPFAGMKRVDFIGEAAVAMGETPSAAANCSARGLARIAAMMSARGRFGDREYLSKDGWEALHAEPLAADMGFAPTIFTQGGVNRFVPVGTNASRFERAFNEGREGFYGWMGFGGSIFQWHPDHEIGFAFVPTLLHAVDLMNERGKVYQAEVLRCVQQLKE